MTRIVESDVIPGVKIVHFQAFADGRGQFMETFRKEWFPERTWQIIQMNRSESCAGVLRGLHFHRRQVDYWQVIQGAIRVGLADLRRSSPAYRSVQTLDLNAESQVGVFIPIGVAHGFAAQSAATLLYVVDNYYDGNDELGIAWNDPDLAIDWGLHTPLVSSRDQQNPRLRDLPPDQLPA
jgi:dTDP-4-dehydrorhamnose 3,5-epimerase